MTMTTMEFEVVPELALRSEALEFVLGMPLRLAIAGIQRLAGTVKGVELVYSAEAPLGRPTILNLPLHGIRLAFHARDQRLMSIQVYDFSKVSLRYCSTVFSTPKAQATSSLVEQAFGATHPGAYESETESYVLSWRGLSFAFPAESPPKPEAYSAGVGGLGSLELGAESGVSPVARMSIFSAPDPKTAPPTPAWLLCGNVALQSLSVQRMRGRTVALSITHLQETSSGSRLADVSTKSATSLIRFGDLAEDVYSALGAPCKVFYKAEDKMRIHRPSGGSSVPKTSDPARVDYFANYFGLGLVGMLDGAWGFSYLPLKDILFDARSNRAKKFILRTNYPGHFDFGMYDRCQFNIVVIGDGETVSIDAFTKWEDISEVVWAQDSDSPRQPVVLNRTNGHGTGRGDNPFGSTFCYGYQDLIFEVMPNGHLASVTIFDADHA